VGEVADVDEVHDVPARSIHINWPALAVSAISLIVVIPAPQMKGGRSTTVAIVGVCSASKARSVASFTRL